jgi:hypothetical protein
MESNLINLPSSSRRVTSYRAQYPPRSPGGEVGAVASRHLRPPARRVGFSAAAASSICLEPKCLLTATCQDVGSQHWPALSERQSKPNSPGIRMLQILAPPLRLGARRNKLEPAHHPSPLREPRPGCVLSTVGMEVFTGAPYVRLQSRVRRGMYRAADVDGVVVCLSSQRRVHNTVWGGRVPTGAGRVGSPPQRLRPLPLRPGRVVQQRHRRQAGQPRAEQPAARDAVGRLPLGGRSLHRRLQTRPLHPSQREVPAVAQGNHRRRGRRQHHDVVDHRESSPQVDGPQHS